jgi:metal-responsive CopG/Arc/MetJ family transcriptional regulator
LSAELIKEIDAEVGPRKRSQFVQQAVEEKLRRQRLRASIKEMAGSLADVDIPGWESSEAAAEWVRALRRGELQPDLTNAVR